MTATYAIWPAPGSRSSTSVFIDSDAALESRYGQCVPVLYDPFSTRELGWPFDAARVRTFQEYFCTGHDHRD